MKLCFFALILLGLAAALPPRHTIAEWVSVDYDWEFMQQDRQTWLDEGLYIPWNCAVAGLKTYNHEMFVTIPRWRPGVVATLNVVVRDGHRSLLRPWPSLDIQNITNGNILYVQSMEIDPTGVMWVIDAGIQNNLDPNPALYSYSTPRLLLIDIATEKITQTFDLSSVSVTDATFLNDIVVNYKTGTAFITDSGPDTGGLIVVNVNTGYMARYEGKSTEASPSTDGKYDICGRTYELSPVPSDGIAYDPIGERLYYCALAGLDLWSLDAKVFADPSASSADIENTVAFHGQKRGISDGLTMSSKQILFYGDNTDCTIMSWNVTQGTLSGTNQHSLQKPDPQQCVWADTFAWNDLNGHLLATTNRLPLFVNLVSDYTGGSGPNFRVLSWEIHQQSYLMAQ